MIVCDRLDGVYGVIMWGSGGGVGGCGLSRVIREVVGD